MERRNRRAEAAPGAELALPGDVSRTAWSLEVHSHQNPRIRLLLGCIRELESVLESNFAIIHCSPRRAQRIWSTVRSVVDVLRGKLRDVLQGPSCVPALHEAVHEASQRLSLLDNELLAELEARPAELPEELPDAEREFLCVATGTLYGFLVDTLGGLLAADPRGRADADYFISRRFARDAEESLWLLRHVVELEERLTRLEETRQHSLSRLAHEMARRGKLPNLQGWQSTNAFMGAVQNELVPQLSRIVGLRGIRVEEFKSLDRFSRELPALCRQVDELYETGWLALRTFSDAESAILSSAEVLFATRIAERMGQLDASFRDLFAFVPLWRKNLSQRRALMIAERFVVDHEPQWPELHACELRD